MNMKQRKKKVVCAQENDVDRMNENDGGGVCWSLSLLIFFSLLPLPKRVEPHIGSFLSLDIFEDCSSPLQQFRIIFIEIFKI